MKPAPPDLWRYYAIPPEVPSDSEAADHQRQQLIREQMAVYRRKPFIASAIFWTYQDYRTRVCFQMGVVDARRHRRGSWTILREANAPVLIDTLNLTPGTDRTQHITVILRARGPIEIDLPAYTLRGYQLEWAVAAPDGRLVFTQGHLPLPTLAPGTTWSGVLSWIRPAGDYWLTLWLVRPTGFAILEQTYDAQGYRLANGARPWRGAMLKP